MTDVYTQENASKKKFLAPVLVILLCMVSLTAAGYAYSATVDNTDDDVIIDGVTMGLFKADGTTPVTAAMYLVDDIDVGSHTTNGRAIWYAEGDGFKADDYAAYTPSTSDYTTYDSGYYVAVYKGGDRVEYQADPAEPYDAETIVAAATAGDKGVYQIGNGTDKVYTLQVSNKSGINVSVNANIDLTAVIAAPAIKNVYILVEGTAAGAAITPVFQKVTSGDIELVGSLVNGKDATLTIKMFIELSDYKSANYASILPGTEYEFAVGFEAATVTP